MRHEPYRRQTHGCRSRRRMPDMASTRRARGQHRRYESAGSLLACAGAACSDGGVCLILSIKRVRVTRNTTHRHTSTHARVGALPPMPSCLGIGGHTGGSRQDTHGTPVPAQWEVRGWLRARPQTPHNHLMQTARRWVKWTRNDGNAHPYRMFSTRTRKH